MFGGEGEQLLNLQLLLMAVELMAYGLYFFAAYGVWLFAAYGVWLLNLQLLLMASGGH